ncbi:MAG: hypothetical protein IKD10_00755 [Lentisphaeria bacterium]|nr:hypothetical protein [Lentisphaeria bacterium]
MGKYLLLTVIDLLSFLLLNIPLIIAANTFGKKIAGDAPELRLSITIFLFLLQGTVIFSVLGLLGVLSLAGGFTGSIISCITLLIAASRLPGKRQELQIEKSNYSERFMTCLMLFILAVLTLKNSSYAGVDTFLYHIFYPAMWLEYGRIYPVNLMGLPHEYFPVAGEIMYGWLLLPGCMQPFVTSLQPLAFVMALSATAGLWRICKVPSIFINAGLLLFAAVGIIQENVCLAYTDALTGSFFVLGITLMVLAFTNVVSNDIIKKIFSGGSGIALGLTAAIKYSGLIMAPVSALVMLVLFLLTDKKSGLLKKNQAKYWIFIISAFFTGLCFYLPNWLRTGNPFYPVKIPFLFSNGIDFERPAVKAADLWNFYVNKNIWDMSECSAIFFLGMIFLSIIFALKNIMYKNKSDVCGTISVVILSSLVGEIVMMAIYPAMTGARQIIPFLSAVAMLFPGVLYLSLGKTVNNKKRTAVFTVLVILIGFFTIKNPHSFFSVVSVGLGIAVSGILAVLKSGKVVRRMALIGGCLFFVLFAGVSLFMKTQAPVFIRAFAGNDNYEIIMHLRDDYNNNMRPLKIASCGFLFNHMLLWDMPGNKVFYIPVNTANTTHPHEVRSLEELREKTVSYELWLERLKSTGINYMAVDLTSHQDFARNRDLELKWAKAHPKIFIPIIEGNGVYLFKLKL